MNDHSLEMSGHLRLIATDPPAEGPTYLVARSEYTHPGTPYVVALCVDDRMANTLALSGHEVYSPAGMREDPGLAEAMTAWEAGDDQLLKNERTARSAFTRSDRTKLFRQVPAQHPSVLSKLQGV